MKKIVVYISVILVVLIATGCSARSYSDSLKEEKKVIKHYIAREGINVINTEPEYGKAWGEKDYLDLGDNLYFHLTKAGDYSEKEDSITQGDYILVRYKRYELSDNADTTSYWTTNDAANPLELQYGVVSSSSCTGWQRAFSHMKYSGSEGKVICPSKLGFTSDQSTVTPYGYDLKFQKNYNK